jgi:peptidoglycan/LPS O-acetylase OafA/YrhL
LASDTGSGYWGERLWGVANVGGMGDSESVRDASRYTALDGLRGLAAFVVLIHHCFLVSPLLGMAARSAGVGQLEPWVWWVTFTPLHLIWAGGEAVFVFFILSGFVLALPFIGDTRTNWAAYLPKRLIRIYVPVWASLILALCAAWAFPRIAGPEFSAWVNHHDEAPNVMNDAVLLWGTGNLNSPLWSLQWEMSFSILLPLYVVVALRFRRRWLVGLTGLVVLIGVGELVRISALVCLPIFGVGVLMSARRHTLVEWATKIGRWGWAGLLVLSVVLLSSRWIFPQFPVGIATATIGGIFVLFAFIGCRMAVSLGNNSLVHWLGTRSFSLYLVHEPIVVSVSFSLHATDPVVVAAIAIPLSLLAAEGFFRLVERPSHRLAQRAGRVVTDRVRREEESTARA